MLSGSLCSRSGWLVAALVLAGNARATNLTPCSSLPHPVYLAGTSTGSAMIQRIAARMATSSVTYVYQAKPSCEAVQAIAAHPVGECTGEDCLSGTAEYYRFNATASDVIDTFQCSIDTPTAVDIALSDFFLNACAPGTDPLAVADIKGPVRPFVFVTPRPVPGLKFARSVSAAEAYMVFGFNVGNVPPWTDPAAVHLPGADSTTELLLSRFLHIPVDQLTGVPAAGERGVMDAMNSQMCVDRSKVLGVVGSDFYDKHRGDELAALAYADPNQAFAFYPDRNSYPNYSAFPNSAVDTRDKQNVRDGHYPLWSYLHMIAHTDPDTFEPVHPEAVRIEHYFDGSTPIGTIHNLYDVYNGAVDSGLVPLCSMTVRRVEEAGPLSTYADPAPCGCAFAATGGPAPTGCKTCNINGDCSSGQVCRTNFCEAR